MTWGPGGARATDETSSERLRPQLIRMRAVLGQLPDARRYLTMPCCEQKHDIQGPSADPPGRRIVPMPAKRQLP